jgi:hypothetical protein
MYIYFGELGTRYIALIALPEIAVFNVSLACVVELFILLIPFDF